MSRRTKLWIIASVILVHAVLFLTVARQRALPHAHYVPPKPTPNFFYDEDVITDPKTGARTIYREIRVSTKLADPAKLPPRATPTPPAAADSSPPPTSPTPPPAPAPLASPAPAAPPAP